MVSSFGDIFLALLVPFITFILYEIHIIQKKMESPIKVSTNDVLTDVKNNHSTHDNEMERGEVTISAGTSEKMFDGLPFAVEENRKGEEDEKVELKPVLDTIERNQLEITEREKNALKHEEGIHHSIPSRCAAGSTCHSVADAAEANKASRPPTVNPLVLSSRQEQHGHLEDGRETTPNGADVRPHTTALPTVGETPCGPSSEEPPSPRLRFHRPTIVIAYASNSRASLSLAHRLFNSLQNALYERKSFLSASSSGKTDTAIIPDIRVMELLEDDALGLSSCALWEEKLLVLTIFIVSTFAEGRAPPRSQSFELLLQDAYHDHRIARDVLSRKRFALLGLGDVAYGDRDFNRFGKNVCTWCRSLGAPPFIVPPIYATVRVQEELFQRFSRSLLIWTSRATFFSDGQVLMRGNQKKKGRKGKNAREEHKVNSDPCNNSMPLATPGSRDDGARGDDEDDEDKEGTSLSTHSSSSFSDVEDVEDIVGAHGEDGIGDDASTELPELLYPKLRQNLTKQGYQLIGSHSGVKLCRWTKSMLRGRGGCYKHTFYNINSSQCMEMTPSLACANKCIFCWRHHTNPVSRNFRWKQDPPDFLLANGMRLHYQMIKQMRGVPGVTPERLEDAMIIRHCALSLVGEPIMYPQINGFCQLLHEHHISSFMVTNAQFPEQLRDLQPVVQLYLSIDAATPEELKRVDRPLFEDYWERCLECVQELRRKKQRTVFRLTLVNEYNAGNIESYADLVMQGWPDFIEVKGVTYCGTSNSSTLTMKANVPRHDEVIQFCADLCEEVAHRHPNYVSAVPPEENISFLTEAEKRRPYNIACEHEHSCCVLIALDKFIINGQWHTWIDYDRFFALIEEGQIDFTSLDYCAPTPSWAVYRSPEAGFDPQQVRVTKTGKPRPCAPEKEENR